MKTKILILFFTLCAMVDPLLGQVGGNQGQTKKMVAIYVARGKGDQKLASHAKLFASELQLAVSRHAMYNAVERTGRFLELLSKEQSYQRTGQVDESKIAELGKQEGVDYVLSVDLEDFGNNTLYVVWKLIDVKTAIVKDGDSEIKEIVNMVADLKAFSEALTKRITGGSMPASGSLGSGFQDGEMITLEEARRNKVELASCKRDNQRLGDANRQLEKQAVDLTKSLSQSDARIESLQQELVSIKDAYAALQSINSDLQSIKNTKYEVYWLFGTKKELESWRNFPRSRYTKGDYRNFNTFETRTRDSKNLYLRTHHPYSSYRWDYKDPRNTKLIILDKEKFWSISRYCVIQLK